VTPLPAFSEQVVERRDLPEYEIEPRCANPRCPNRAEHPHEIRPRSQTAGLSWWVELPGRFLIGNRVGLCAGCHRRTDDHTVAIIWDDQMSELAWCDLASAEVGGDWAEALNPMPPIHLIGADRSAAPSEMLPGPKGDPRNEPDVDEVARQELEVQPDDMATLGRSMQNMEAFLGSVREAHALEGADVVRDSAGEDVEVTAIEPVVLEPGQELPPEDGGPAAGDDAETVAKARAATEEAQQRAVDVTGLGEFAPPAAPWQAAVIVFPEENRVEVLSGDLRVGSFIEEQIEKAKRAPKPRAARETKKEEKPDREREPAKARRTYSISVPSDERDGEKVAAGEDGYTLIEEALDNLRQRFGRDDHPGWRYFVLLEALQWMLLNYTDEGEDG
jgi:hypothetical protein